MNFNPRNRSPAPNMMNPQFPNLSVPPPNFSMPPPPNMNGNFPCFSGPIHNQPTFPMGRMPPPCFNTSVPPPSICGGNPHQGFIRPGGPPFGNRPPGYVNDDIFGDAPKDVPCGFPYFNPCQPPPGLPNAAMSQPVQQSGGGRGFRGAQNRGRGGFRGRGHHGGMNQNGAPFPKGRGGNNNNDNNNANKGGFQKKKQKGDKRDLPENNVYFCDICDRGFKNKEMHQEHIDSHQKCSYKDCPYVAAPKLVQLHISLQHRGGLAKRIWSVASEEDVKKWTAERKKNYPTADNIKKKKAIIEEKLSRGEVIETKDFSKMNRRNRGRGRGRGRGRFRKGWRRDEFDVDGQEDEDDDSDDESPPEEVKIKRSKAQDETESDKMVGGDEDASQSKKSRKSDSCSADAVESSGVVKVKGAEAGLSSTKYESSSADCSEMEDDDEEENGEATVPSKPNSEGESSDVIFVSSSVPVLCDSTSGSESPSPSQEPSPSKNSLTHSSSHNGGIKQTREQSQSELNVSVTKETEDSEQIECELEEACRNSETVILLSPELDNNDSLQGKESGGDIHNCGTTVGDEPKLSKATDDAGSAVKGNKRGRTTSNKRHASREGPPNKKAKGTGKQPEKSYTLLEKLLAKGIRRERNKILQCIHFIVKNKFFEVDPHTV